MGIPPELQPPPIPSYLQKGRSKIRKDLIAPVKKEVPKTKVVPTSTQKDSRILGKTYDAKAIDEFVKQDKAKRGTTPTPFKGYSSIYDIRKTAIDTKQKTVEQSINEQKKKASKALTTTSYISGPKADEYNNFDKAQAKANITKQLNYQNNFLGQRGFKYQHKKDMNKITDLMSYSLAEAGIKDIKQLGFKKVQGEGTSQRVTKRKGKYYTHVEKTIGYGGGPEPRLIDAEDIDDIKTDAQGITTATVKPYASYMLINKDTGEEVIQGKYAGQLTKYDKDQGFRWGNTTQTEGMTDFMIKFDDKGEALIYPRYEDTASDLTGLTMVAGIALAGTGFGAGLGGKLFAGASSGFQASVGNALVNATISQATGGDFFKSFLTSALVPSVQAGLDNALGNSMFANMNVNPAFKRVASSTINSSITNGVAAAINGQDIGKAMYRGAILGGAGSATNQITSKIFTNDNLKFITDNTNLSYKQVMGAANLSVRKGVYNLTKGRNFFDGLTDSLVAHGVSSSVSNKVRSSLEATMKDNPAAIKMLTQTTGTLTNLYTKAAMSGRQVSPEMLQRILIEKAVAPSIVSQTSKAIKQVAKKGKEDLENLTES